MSPPTVADLAALHCGHRFMAHLGEDDRWCVHHEEKRASVQNDGNTVSEVKNLLATWHRESMAEDRLRQHGVIR